MKVERLPLSYRLSSMEKGFAAHPEFAAAAIEELACVPICRYMRTFTEEWEELKETLGISDEEEESMTYLETARRIDNLWNETRDLEMLTNLLFLLSAPFQYCCKVRMEVLT